MTTRTAIGRGLNALFNLQGSDTGGVREIPLDLLKANPGQPRVDFDDEAIEGLAESIRENGVIQPLVARPIGDQYQVVTGERRLRAAKRAGLSAIPVVVRHDLRDEDVLLLALVENLQREDLNPVEEARGMDRLVNETKVTHEELAKKLGKSRAHVTNTLRLLKLPEEVLGWLRAGKLSAGHARTLLGLDTADQVVLVAARVVDEGWSVRRLEEFIRTYSERRDQAVEAGAEAEGAEEGDGDLPDAPPPRRVLKAAGKELTKALGSKVTLRQAPGKAGKLVIEFKTRKELEKLLKKIGNVSLPPDEE